MSLKVFASLLCFASVSLAQTSRITGRVTDASGAAAAGAPVVATHVESGTKYSAQVNTEGYYTASRLDPGEYEVSVQHSGFRPVVRKGIALQVDQTVRVDVILEVGGVVEKIEITAAAPLVESETSDVGQVVDNKSIVEMPLNGRNAWDLATLAAGTVYIQATGDAGEIPVVSIGGSRTMSQGFMLDGGSVQKSGMSRSQAELAPMVDAVDEFKVITNNYAAEYGRSAGGVFSAVTKTGTNQFRGNLFEFMRNDAIDARNFFSLVKAPLRFHQFGGTIGGPIRKDKTHFFAALETTRSRRGQTLVLSVPTPAQKAGDFSKTVDAAGRSLPIYNPFTNRLDAAGTTTIRDPVPGNIMPASLFDPVAVKALSYYPDPNQPGTIAGANNYIVNVAPRRSQLHGTLRVDHTLTSKDRVFGRFVAQYNDAPEASVFPEPAASGQGPATRSILNYARSVVVSWVRTVTPSVLNDLKFATIDQTRDITHASLDQGWAGKLGLTGIGARSFPIFRPAGYTFLGSPNTYRAQTNPSRQILENVSWYRGGHSFKAGFEYRHNRTTDEFDRQPGGDFTFAQAGSGLQGNARTGIGVATMLFGYATAATLNDSPLMAFNNYYMGVYLQDDWKVTPRLTLNLGVRYDLEPGRAADDNMQNGFDLARINPASGTPGVVTFAGVDEPTRLFDTDRNNIAPRLGFAWRPFASNKTVFRGGFGVFFSNPDDSGFNNTGILGFATQLSLSSADSQSPVVQLRNGFKQVTAPGPQDRTPSYGIGNAVDFFQRERATPYSLQYNFGFQHEVKSVLISPQYMSNVGVKLTANPLSINQVPPELVGKTGSIQSRRPFPQFTDVTMDSPNLGHSSYHAFALRAEKRYRGGLQFLGNYTFAKFLDNVDSIIDFGGTPGNGYQDYYNRRADKSRSSNDIRHLSSFNAIWDLPAGPRRRWLKHGTAAQVLGGWQLSALGMLRSGAAYGVQAQQNLCECNSAGPMRPNLLRDPNLPAGQRTVSRWFDTAAFLTPDRFQFGSAARALGDGPGAITLNLALMKNFIIRERFRVQFRGEAFNAINHANFGMPGLVVGAGTFGIISSASDGRVLQFGLKLYF